AADLPPVGVVERAGRLQLAERQRRLRQRVLGALREDSRRPTRRRTDRSPRSGANEPAARPSTFTIRHKSSCEPKSGVYSTQRTQRTQKQGFFSTALVFFVSFVSSVS